MTYNSTHVVSVAKVASASMAVQLRRNGYQPTTHTHDLEFLRDVVNSSENNLIVSGVRNPVDRNLSYFFQGFVKRFHSQFKIKKNNYTGEVIQGVQNLTVNDHPQKVIDTFKNQQWLYTFTDWFEEFFEIVDIYDKPFDKQKGYKIYKIKNNNTLLIYTVEQLPQSLDSICNDIGIVNISTHHNNSKDREYSCLYTQVKETIIYEKEYLDKLLGSNIINYFYTDQDIHNMYKKYSIHNEK